jgi:hypothetical protein
MKRKPIIPFIVSAMLLTVVVTAQKNNKKWTDWSKKDAEKMLDNSPWA